MRATKIIWIAAAFMALVGTYILFAMPKQVKKDLFGHQKPTWYYFLWAAEAPYTPVFKVLDTESILGRYATKTKAITLKDLVKMHGHLCDGLIFAACALKLAFNYLCPDGIIDQTDTAGITNNWPCFGDVMAYLTGGRIRFGTLKIDPSLRIEFIVKDFPR